MNEPLIAPAPLPAAQARGAETIDIDARFLPAYRRFAPEHSLRQAIVFPEGEIGNRMALQRKTARGLACGQYRLTLTGDDHSGKLQGRSWAFGTREGRMEGQFSRRTNA